MYIGRIETDNLAERLHPGIAKFIEFVRTADLSRLPLGKNVIDGDDVFVMHNDIQGVEAEKQPLEMHRRYIDVHVLLEGDEKIGWLPIDKVENYSQEYNEEGDCALSPDSPAFYVDMTPGDFCVVFPEDPHAPAISSGRIHKLIGKVKV